ncbi:HDL343Wp [Eremothecium sinecaudum]|uniref:Autophagy-related protein 13 n=1 Tax=Eremothecium sinecaudum TaxID=45286 RepID=A0A109UWW2_9SACH|nr:HDL343Wp [Eremothecium sinecaudum]AMD20401.1 HDL343Wp [Eremothecium sinecaudum]
MLSEPDTKVIELINSYFTKAALLICQSKSLNDYTEVTNVTTDSSFNINTIEDSHIQDELKPWTNFNGEAEVPPLVVETYLDLRNLTPSHMMILKDHEGNPWNVCKGGKKTEIMLERWLIELDRNRSDSEGQELETPAEIYKQLVLLFRYLYTLTQLLPANDLYTKLSKPSSDSDSISSLLHIGTRILDGSKAILSKGRVGLSRNIIATYTNVINETNVASHLEQKKITPIFSKFGSLRITVSYRRDCDFHVIEKDEDDNGNLGGSAVHGSQGKNDSIQQKSHTRASVPSDRSISLSPKSNYSSTLPADSSPQRKSSALKIHPFKVGSVGSGTYSGTRNTSGSSAIATLRAQRSTSGPISTPIGAEQPHVGEQSSVGSGGSKYSSSFGRIRRHSSVRYSDSLERNNTKRSNSNEQCSDDLLDFVKFLDDKQELNVKKLYGTTTDISSSLIRFQSMKSNNDTLSEDLSMSYSLEPAHVPQVRYRSNSHSPIPAFSPSVHYASIPMRLSQSRNPSQPELVTRKSSTDRIKSLISSRTGSFSDQKRYSVAGQEKDIIEDANDDEDDDILLSRSHLSNATGGKLRSISPQSIKSISSYSRNSLPFKPTSNFSYPTTMATPAHAKLHKGTISSSPDNQPSVSKKTQEHNQLSHSADEDDDLLFFMSDMNLSGQER